MFHLVEGMKHRRSISLGEGTTKRSFSPLTLCLCWVGFIALHAFCTVYFATFAWCYWNLAETFLDVWIFFFRLGIDSHYYSVISIVHGCLAVIHLLYLVWMIGWSLKKRRPVVAAYNVFTQSKKSTRKLNQQTWIITRVYRTALSKMGVLGVDGPYFDLVLLFREIVETALQTQQAYRMSSLLPRTELNRGYVAMLVINCWSTALVHSVYKFDATKRRMLAVMCDCALDLVTSVGITSVLLAIYYPDFDSKLSGFPTYKWYEDVWVVHVLSEFQLLLVSSWGDLTLRVVFALSMLSNMNNIKRLLSMRAPQRRKSKLNHQVTAVLPLNPSFSDITDSRTQSKLDIVLDSESQITKIIFLVWGAAILVIHLYAESISELPQCKMQVKPWVTSQTSCSLLVLDCYQSELSGSEDEVIAEWSNFDPTTTSRVVIRHCPKLEMPSFVTEFSRLKVLKIYNSTITSWEESAALSQLHHPNLMSLYLVRVNMTNGELPPGLRGDNFPQILTDFEFCTTNLRSLPDDFDLKWPQFSSIYLEKCAFTEVPASLARLAPYDLSLAMNSISSLPAPLFEGGVGYLHVGSTLISELPHLSVPAVSNPLVLRVDNTNMSFFWDWIDPRIADGALLTVEHPILATNSPYCSDLQRIYNGEQENFSAPWREGQSQILSDASVESWPMLRATVSCDEMPNTWYPLDFEDGPAMDETPPWSRSTRHVSLSPCGFTFWWFIILGIHLVACVYNIAYAKLYWGFELTMFSFLLEFNRIGISRENYSTVAYVYIMLAVVHSACALLMLVGSICQRKLAFMPKWRKKGEYFGRNTKRATDAEAVAPPVDSYRVIRLLSTVYHRLGSHFGVFGVNGKYFHVILICREVIEVALQTTQAIRMSKYLPRLLLNRFYVSLLVLNCWSAVFVYSHWFWRDEARRRFAAIVCDCVLNLMSTIGVTLIITLSYVSMYDINNFDWHVLDDDEWFSQMLNEARVVLVMSWLDLVSRIVFSLGVVSTTSDMKELLRCKSTQKNQVTSAGGPTLTNIGPKGGDIGVSKPNTQLVGRFSTYKSTGFRTRWSLWMLQGIHYAFAAWGVVILSLHVHAAMQTPLLECTPKVYPMAGALPSCYTVRLDCNSMGISGLKQEISKEWDRFDHSTTVKLLILHCASLEVPDSFQGFSGLESIVVYNSTIVDWSDTAAITNSHHPHLNQITIVRVNMTGGSLSLGFQATDSPLHLFQMNFCVTNLKTLPDDLDSKWIARSVVLLENSELTDVPMSLIRLQPYYLSLAGNPIAELPPELFEGKIEYIFVGNTQVNELPVNVIPTTLSTLDVTNTNISFFPTWIDPLVEVSGEMYQLLVAGGSTYCSDLERIRSGVSTDFSAPFQPEQSLMLMNASKANWEVLSQVVDCSTPLLTTQFSLDYFDETYSLDGGVYT